MVAKCQLFKNQPPQELTLQILNCFGLKGLDDTTNFSKNDIVSLETVSKVGGLKEELAKCYIPCKARTYLNDLNEKNVLTILRQCLRAHGHRLSAREKYIKGEKFVIYQVIPTAGNAYQPVSVVGKPCEVHFA